MPDRGVRLRVRRARRPHALACSVVAAISLAGCAYPRVVDYYDEECQIMARKMILDAAKVDLAESCRSETCLIDVAVGAAALATTVVVSGSIVYIGNVIYWKERNRKCRRDDAPPAGPEGPRT